MALDPEESDGEAGKITCRLRNISKAFGPVQALDDVSVDIGEVEILAIVGENGAGKSTLMNVLFGLVGADRGELELGDRSGLFRDSAEAIAAGLGMVHQHFMLYPELTVLENVLVGAEGKTTLGLIDFPRCRRDVQELVNAFGFGLDLDARIEGLTMGARQRVEIIKMLHRGSRIIVLDEPTAVLLPQEVDALFEVIRKLRSEGRSIILVTHKLAEVMAISDRVVVMRAGRKVGEVLTATTDASELAGMMVGREIATLEKVSSARDEVVLSVRDLTVLGAGDMPLVNDVSLAIKAGEILGIAGVSGSGQKEFVEALVGIRKQDRGGIALNGRSIADATIRERRAAGLAYIAEDRMSVGLAIEGTVAENVIAGREQEDRFSGRLLLRFGNIRAFAEDLITRFDVRTTGPAQKAADLSGGNKQKVIVARELAGAPKLIIAENPCWGVDIGAISFIQQQLLDCADDGAAILLVSTELDELFQLCDRVAVFFAGSVTAEFERSNLDSHAVGRAMSGSEAA